MFSHSQGSWYLVVSCMQLIVRVIHNVVIWSVHDLSLRKPISWSRNCTTTQSFIRLGNTLLKTFSASDLRSSVSWCDITCSSLLTLVLPPISFGRVSVHPNSRLHLVFYLVIVFYPSWCIDWFRYFFYCWWGDMHKDVYVCHFDMQWVQWAWSNRELFTMLYLSTPWLVCLICWWLAALTYHISLLGSWLWYIVLSHVLHSQLSLMPLSYFLHNCTCQFWWFSSMVWLFLYIDPMHCLAVLLFGCF